MAGLRLVVFDVDGTLIDSLAHIKAAMAQAFASCDMLAPPEAAIRQIIGLSLPQAMARLAPDVEKSEVDALVAGYKTSFASARSTQSVQDTAPLFPGTREMLTALSQRDDILLGVATGKSRRGLEAMFAAHDLGGLFVTTQVADDHPSKPHPSMLEQTLHETGVAPQNAVMIGDTTFDLEMGRAAGFHTVGVRWGYHDDTDLVPLADVMLNGFDELHDALTQFQVASA